MDISGGFGRNDGFIFKHINFVLDVLYNENSFSKPLLFLANFSEGEEIGLDVLEGRPAPPDLICSPKKLFSPTNVDRCRRFVLVIWPMFMVNLGISWYSKVN